MCIVKLCDIAADELIYCGTVLSALKPVRENLPSGILVADTWLAEELLDGQWARRRLLDSKHHREVR